MSWNECELKNKLKIAAALIAASIIMTAIFINRTDAPNGLEAIAPVYQSDYKGEIVKIDGVSKSVWTSGCGAVVAGMAAGYMTGVSVSCEDLFRWACERGYYAGNGLDHSALTAMLAPFGLSGTWVENERLDLVISALNQRLPVVAHVGPGTFTNNGHYILLIGYDNGRALVNDPGSRDRSGQYFDLELIQKQLRREKSFMIVGRA